MYTHGIKSLAIPGIVYFINSLDGQKFFYFKISLNENFLYTQFMKVCTSNFMIKNLTYIVKMT